MKRILILSFFHFFIFICFAQRSANIVFIGNSITYGALHEQRELTAPPTQCARWLSQQDDIDTVYFRNCGRSGKTTYHFLPNAADVIPAGDKTYFADVVAKTRELVSTHPTLPLVFSIMLGTNDTVERKHNSHTTPDDYAHNLCTIIDSLLKLWPEAHVVLNKPIWYTPDYVTKNGSVASKQSLKLLDAYYDKFPQVVKNSKPGHVHIGDSEAYAHFKKHYKTDVFEEKDSRGRCYWLHPNEQGAKKLAEYWGKAILPVLMSLPQTHWPLAEPLPDEAWNDAEWVSVANAPVVTGRVNEQTRAADGANWFVTTIQNDREVVKALWMTTSLGINELYVNGQRIGNEVLRPGFSHHSRTKYSFTYDVTHQFQNFFNEDGTFKCAVLNTMQTPALFALRNNLFEGEAKAKTIERLRENFSQHDNCLQTGFLGTSILMPTLTDNGMADVAYTLLFQRKNPSWLYSVDNGATTIWERWNSYMKEKGMGPNGMNSFNHYAYGCVCQWLWQTCAGIASDPARPGFRHIIMKPVPDRRLGHLDASYQSAAGLIKSSWRYEGDEWIWTVTIPEGATATVHLPDGKVQEIASGTNTFQTKISQ